MIQNREKILIRYVSLPEAVRGVSTVLDDNRYMIVINDTLSEEDQNEALEHELEHIRRGDLNKEKIDVSEVEKEVHKIIKGVY